VAVCCSSASLNARLKPSTSLFGSAPGCVVGLASFKGPAHSSQNFACGRFSCWHRGQGISDVSRFRLGAGQDHAAPDPFAPAGVRRSGRCVGHGRPDRTPTRPRAPDRRFRPSLPDTRHGGSRPLRRVSTHVYASVRRLRTIVSNTTTVRSMQTHRNRWPTCSSIAAVLHIAHTMPSNLRRQPHYAGT
jgi:hypothetical protein